jgi:hypothetical protein
MHLVVTLHVTDSADDYDGTVIETDPNSPATFVTGIIGQAISLDGIGDAVSIPRSIQDSFTIGLWVKTAAIGGTGMWWEGTGLVDGETPVDNDFGTALLGSKFGFGVSGSTNLQTITSTSNINDNQWHYCTATRDFFTGEMKVYVDGKLEATVAGDPGTKDSATALRIGSIQTGVNYLNGLMDDVKLCNFAKTHQEVVDDFYAVTSIPVCITKNVYDFNGNCVVDLADFAVFASNWLDCGLYPQLDCPN